MNDSLRDKFANRLANLYIPNSQICHKDHCSWCNGCIERKRLIKHFNQVFNELILEIKNERNYISVD